MNDLKPDVMSNVQSGERVRVQRSLREWALASVLIWIVLAGLTTLAGAQSLDEDVFAAQVPPNVVLMVDNSGSMNAGIEHESFARGTSVVGCNLALNIATSTPTDGSTFFDYIPDDLGRGTVVYGRYRACTACTGSVFGVYIHDSYYGDYVTSPSSLDHPSSGYVTRRFCGNDIQIWSDGETEDANRATRFSGDYMGWLYSLNGGDNTSLQGPVESQKTPQVILSDFQDGSNGRDFNTGTYFGIYHRSRITAARHIAADVIYQTNTDCPAFTPSCTAAEDRVRFGLALFDANSDGGFVKVPVDAFSVNRAALQSEVQSIEALTATPLAETLFKLYTYFMSRTAAQIPAGVTAGSQFPDYSYGTADGLHNGANIPPSPVTQECQKNFVIMITDGEPIYDNFYDGRPQGQGFDDFDDLIGDFFTDAVGDVDTPETGSPPWGTSGTGYLDDVASFMQTRDFRPDYPNTLNKIDVYTVGFTTQGLVNSLLTKTAANGNGLFFTGNQSDVLTEALVSSVQDIISKSQGFSAATVPAARTSNGGSLYTSLFQPSSDRSFWPGVLRSYKITAGGEIQDANGDCALEDLAIPGICAGGKFKSETDAPPFWNASKVMPATNTRRLYVSVETSTPSQVAVQWDHNITAAQLGMIVPQMSDYPLSPNIANATELDEGVRAYIAGCEWGSGLTTAGSDEFSGCITRQVFVDGVAELDLLGDIFHSNPVVVGPPSAFIPEPSYGIFASLPALIHRERLIYAGANDGFFHGFNAGNYGTVLEPTAYDEGTGIEKFGFMPWGARTKVQDIVKDSSTVHPLTVDGSPSVADVWIDRNANPSDAKVATEWSTIMISGLREGGEHYFALDITDPAAAIFPTYLWEFPNETDPDWAPYIGQTWSQPVITRIRLEGSGSEIIEKWVAIVGFGYDTTSDPNKSGPAGYDATATKGRGVAMIDVATGRPLAVRRFGTNTTNGEVPDMLFAMPSQPGVLDINQDGFADLIYIGDLGGNIWKWVVRAPGTNNPTPAELFQANWPFRKFFDEDPTTLSIGDARSFFFSPAATLSRGVLHLGVGTGQRSNMNCSSTSAVAPCAQRNRFYVIKDRDVWDAATPSIIDGRAYPTGALTDVTAFEDACPGVQPNGFFFTVASDGEKYVTNSEVFDSFFFSSTFTPNVTNVCEPTGDSLLYGFLAKCGQGFFGPPSPTSPIAGIERTLNIGKGIPTDARLSIAPGEGGNRLIISKQNGEIINIDSGASDAEHGVLYWREVD